MFKLCYRFTKAHLPVFKQYPLHPKILEILDTKGLHTATPVQDMLFTCQNKVRLLIGPTGTGKTYAYLLPILGKLKQEEEEQNKILTEENKPRAIVVVSTKELAEQVEDVSQEFTKAMKLSTLALGKGTFKKEQSYLQEGVDLVVTTLDRLQRHRSAQSIYLSRVSHYVVDEIDTLLDSSMQDDLKKLATYFKDKDITTTYCGATYSTKVKNFVESQYKNQITPLIEKQSHMHLENLSHDFVHCTTLDKSEPFMALYKECQNKFKGSIIIFCNEISSCHFLEFFCKKNGIKTVSLHGDLPKGMRSQNVAEFRSQQCKVLITTDLGARGLDFPFVDAVINFDFPNSTSDYLHRAGRAGRAGKKGFIYSLYHNSQQSVIDELRKANEGERPIRIEESAYSKTNKEDSPKGKVIKSKSQEKQQSKTKSQKQHYVKGYKPAQKQTKQERTTSKSYFKKVHEGKV
ncbi:unnamed protein product [Paramecium primaurelia]|uniref:ATP-dependent RNA helicase n=1 Tax=Paramecium primaurelia TaxID=5886 RepID=A0A8S1PU24_PARPR|nr:unnamed protein product [Paramecium primaurelia]